MMQKAKPAGFHTLIDDLAEDGLLQRLIIGVRNVYEAKPDVISQEIARLPKSVHEFWINEDHGLAHSKQVLERLEQILEACPNTLRSFCARFSYLNDPGVVKALTVWASVLHDFARFTSEFSLKEHQAAGANLAYYCNFTHGLHVDEIGYKIDVALYQMIIHHDYICKFVDREPLPEIFLTNPLAEIFRLADKTSLSPTDEISRYYATSKRYPKTVFFNPELTDEQRFNFSGDHADWDYLNHFLLLFAIQPSDWFYGETRDLYRQWQSETGGGKHRAILQILELAEAEGLNADQRLAVSNTLNRFFLKFDLPNWLV